MNIVIQKKNPKIMEKLNNAINKGNDVFLFISADWCGHCKNMKPEWAKLSNNKYGQNVVIANVNSELNDDILGFGPKAEGFPDLRYINKQKGIIEKYEDSKLPDMTRTYNAFQKWITSKIGNKSNTKHIKGMVYGKTIKHGGGNKTRRRKTRGNKTKKRK